MRSRWPYACGPLTGIPLVFSTQHLVSSFVTNAQIPPKIFLFTKNASPTCPFLAHPHAIKRLNETTFRK